MTAFAVLSHAQFWLSRRHVFRKIFRGCFRGKLPVNHGAHEYLNALLLSTCFRRCFRGLTLTHSFRGAFARGDFAFAGCSPHESEYYSKSIHGGFWCCSSDQDIRDQRKQIYINLLLVYGVRLHPLILDALHGAPPMLPKLEQSNAIKCL